MKTCNQCRQTVPDDAGYCTRCGSGSLKIVESLDKKQNQQVDKVINIEKQVGSNKLEN